MMKVLNKELLMLIWMAMSVTLSHGQFNLGFQHFESIKVVEGSDTLRHPWSGGMNNPQFSSLDVDLDGSLDLIAYERDGEVFRAFTWEGGATYSSYFNVSKPFASVGGSYVLFRDYDGDGKQDIFSAGYSNNGARILRNTSTSTSLSFEEVKRQLWFNVPGQGNLFFYIPPNDLPAIADFNGDGDMDILLQGQTGFLSYPALLYFENRSQELYGHSDSLVYRLDNPCWGRIREFVSASGWGEYACDTSNFGGGNRGDRHGGTTLTVLDLDGDSDLDLLTGDAYSGVMSAMFNQNENVDAVVDLALTDTTFPNYDTPVFLPTIPGAYAEDVDHDGLQDLLVSPNMMTYIATTPNDTSIATDVDWYYRNVGTSSAPDFTLQEQGFFSGNMIDVGAKSMPAFIDINGDSLLDLFIGNEGYTPYGGSAGAYITLYLNVGTEEAPVFQLHDQNVGNISQYDFGYVHPALADLDDDGDADLMIGDDQGRLHYFENIGTPSNYQFQLTEPEYKDIDVDLNAHPQFFDLSGDGIEDLIIGDYYGRVYYHENAGTATIPDFSKNPTIDEVGDIFTFYDYGGDATPLFTRHLDSLGTNLYLLLSSAEGTILVYGPINDLTTLDEPMQPGDSIVLDATFTSITGANLFGDFRDELIIGQRAGGLFSLRREKDIPLGVTSRMPDPKLRVFPNPSAGVFAVEMGELANEHAQLFVYNSNGQLVAQAAMNSGVSTIDLSTLPNGVYFVRYMSDRTVAVQRLMKQ